MLRLLCNKVLLGFFLLSGVALQAPAHASENQFRSVLFVVSSEGRSGGEVRPGFEMDELAQAWVIFQENASG